MGLGKDSYYALHVVPHPDRSFAGPRPDGRHSADHHRLQSGWLGRFELDFARLVVLGQEGSSFDGWNRRDEAKHHAPFEHGFAEPDHERRRRDAGRDFDYDNAFDAERHFNRGRRVSDDAASVRLSDSAGCRLSNGWRHEHGRSDRWLLGRSV